MTDNSYDEDLMQGREPSVLDAKIAVLLGPSEQKTILAERAVVGELIASAPGGGIAQVGIHDTIEMVLESIVALGEMLSDHIGARYTDSMPSFIAEFAAALLDTEYNEDDNTRQAQSREAMGMPPLGT